MSRDRGRVLFDLCDIEDTDQIHKLPPEFLRANPHTGRIILDATDPWVTRLILMGYRPLQLQWLPGTDNGS